MCWRTHRLKDYRDEIIPRQISGSSWYKWSRYSTHSLTDMIWYSVIDRRKVTKHYGGSVECRVTWYIPNMLRNTETSMQKFFFIWFITKHRNCPIWIKGQVDVKLKGLLITYFYKAPQVILRTGWSASVAPWKIKISTSKIFQDVFAIELKPIFSFDL